MVVTDSVILSTEGHIRRDFGRSKGAEVTEIHQAWREVVVYGLG